MRTRLLLITLALAGCGQPAASPLTAGPSPIAVVGDPSPTPTCDDRDGFCAPEGDAYDVHVEVTALTPRVAPGEVLLVAVDSECGSGATFVALEYRAPGDRYPRSVDVLAETSSGSGTRYTGRVVVPPDAGPQVALVVASTNCSHLADAGADYAEVRIVAADLPRTG